MFFMVCTVCQHRADPQFLQEMMGYTAELAGMALSQGGAVIMA